MWQFLGGDRDRWRVWKLAQGCAPRLRPPPNHVRGNGNETRWVQDRAGEGNRGQRQHDHEARSAESGMLQKKGPEIRLSGHAEENQAGRKASRKDWREWS